jgi:phage terminase small subunit
MKKANLSIVTGDGIEVNKNLYVILKKLPAPMKRFGLTKNQIFWYNHFGRILIDSKKLTDPDLIHLHALAKSIDYMLQAEEKINEKGYNGGLVQTFTSGATNISAHMTVREKMLKEIDNYSKHFGFSFKDRMKLNEESGPSNQYSLFELEKMAQSS